MAKTSATSRIRIVRSRILEKSAPHLVQPILRAYALGYASSTAPRLLTLLLTHLSRRRKNIDVRPDDPFFLSLIRILRGGLELQRFPTFCAALVGGSTLLEVCTFVSIHNCQKLETNPPRFRFGNFSHSLPHGWLYEPSSGIYAPHLFLSFYIELIETRHNRECLGAGGWRNISPPGRIVMLHFKHNSPCHSSVSPYSLGYRMLQLTLSTGLPNG